MKNITVKRIWYLLLEWLVFWRKFYISVIVEDIPDELDSFKVYIAFDDGNQWLAAMKCPCGCNEVLFLNLLKDTKPCWNISVLKKDRVSIHPSVWRQVGCKSHFIMRNGKIKWV